MPPPVVLYEYQKKGDAGRGFCMSIKTKGIRKAEVRGWMIEGGGDCRIWKGERTTSKSGVETFEWRLITLVSVTWSLLLSQELFYQYFND